MEILVVPAWIAGIQIRKDAPETSMSIWIPALQAGMTQSSTCTNTDRKFSHLLYCSKQPQETV
jgi:hypothetical protein